MVSLTLWHLTSGTPTKSVMLKLPNVKLTWWPSFRTSHWNSIFCSFHSAINFSPKGSIMLSEASNCRKGQE